MNIVLNHFAITDYYLPIVNTTNYTLRFFQTQWFGLSRGYYAQSEAVLERRDGLWCNVVLDLVEVVSRPRRSYGE